MIPFQLQRIDPLVLRVRDLPRSIACDGAVLDLRHHAGPRLTGRRPR